MKKKRLTEEQFLAAVKLLEIGETTQNIAHGVLVEGKPQTEYVSALRLSKGAVSQAVKRVWDASVEVLPDGHERISAILPKYQAFIVHKWAKKAKGKP